MSRPTDKLHLILLALMLIFSPLQSALAGLDFHASHESGQHDMHHADAAATHMDTGRKMSADCQHCIEQGGCDDHKCSNTHCAACTPGLLGFLQSHLMPRESDLYQQFDEILLSCFTSHPFRPPKA